MVNIEAAVELRNKGLTYGEIAVHLDCSVAWCKKNLKEHKKPPHIVERVVVDATKEAAVAILKDALARLVSL